MQRAPPSSPTALHPHQRAPNLNTSSLSLTRSPRQLAMSNLISLPRELVELQLAQLDLLSSLFLPDEFTPSPSVALLYSLLSSSQDGSTVRVPADAAPGCTVTVPLDPPPGALPGLYALELAISLSLGEPPQAPALHLRHPAWLSRSAHSNLCALLHGLPAEEDPMTCVLSALELLRDEAPRLIPLAEEMAKDVGDGEGEVRVWYWFPSLSTRAKRDDMVKWAPGFGLTGFVLAGECAPLTINGRAAARGPSVGARVGAVWLS